MDPFIYYYLFIFICNRHTTAKKPPYHPMLKLINLHCRPVSITCFNGFGVCMRRGGKIVFLEIIILALRKIYISKNRKDLANGIRQLQSLNWSFVLLIPCDLCLRVLLNYKLFLCPKTMITCPKGLSKLKSLRTRNTK